jgi:hypothetical protein
MNKNGRLDLSSDPVILGIAMFRPHEKREGGRYRHVGSFHTEPPARSGTRFRVLQDIADVAFKTK